MSKLQTELLETVHAASREFQHQEYVVLSRLIHLSKGVATVDDVLASVVQMSETMASVAFTTGLLHNEHTRLTHSLRSKPYCLTSEQITDVLNAALTECLDVRVPRSRLVVQYRLTVMRKALKAARASVQRAHVDTTYAAMIAPFTRASDTVLKHEEAFHQHASTLDEPLRKACEMFRDGVALEQVAEQLGFKNGRGLAVRLQRAFDPFFEGIVG